MPPPRGLGKIADIAAIEQWPGRRVDFRAIPVMDHADEFDRHGDYP
jgi:hypothetical protein